MNVIEPTPAVQYHIADGITPQAEIARVAQWLADAAPGPHSAPVLSISRLTGDALALGRYQRGETALTGQFTGETVRRLTGGRSSRFGEGLVSVCLIVPDLFSLTGARSADKTINRGVRGLLRAMGSLGLPALYGGRDMITVTRKPVAMVSMEALENGVCLFQGIVGMATVAAPDESWLTTPPATGLGGAPWAPLTEFRPDLGFKELADAVVAGYTRALDRELVAASAPPSEGAAPGATWKSAGYGWSAPVEVPIGVVEAGVRMEDGRIAGVSLCGDFIAATALVERLEMDLIGAELDPNAVGRAINGVFSGGQGILGLTTLVSIRDAVLDAGNAPS